VPSVPNVLGRADSYAALLELADANGLSHDLVVQTPYGDSGKTTFYIKTEADWNAHADSIVEEELKVMRRINPKAVAVEACITRSGTVVGPVMTELIGYPELTPYRGGWCGNEIYFGALSPKNREQALKFTNRLGDRIAQEGYHGLLEVDYLLDTDSGELYLGELNPRLSGISSMTNVSAGAYADMPLFLFHLAEYLELEYEVDVEEINKRWGSERHTDVWAQIIIKETSDRVELLTEAPSSGTWRIGEDGQMGMIRPDLDWHALHDEAEGFYMQILGPGDYRYEGADLGILVVRHRLQTDEGELTEQCRRWIDAIRARFKGVAIGPSDPGPTFDALAVKAN
jgi:biotin carboxylase